MNNNRLDRRNMKTFYHSADLDGRCSGALVKLAYPECKLFGINYGEVFPWKEIISNETVFMVDFSLQPFSEMIKLASKCNLVWIDHHKSAIDEAFKVDFFAKDVVQLLEIGTGACVLTYRYLFSSQPLPTFVKLLGEYDVWDHSDPRTLPFQYGMRLLDTKPDNDTLWKSLFDVETVQRIVEDGNIVLKYIIQHYENYAKTCAFETEINGLKCLAINRMLANSQLFESIWDNHKYDVMIAFGWRNGKWTVFLYTDKEGIDVSQIAKSHNGGGHKQAAGFQCAELPFELK